MPGKSKRRRNRGQEPGTPTQSAPPKQKLSTGQRRRLTPKQPWLTRNKSALRVYGIIGAVVIGVAVLIAFGVQQSLASDFEFSMYQGADELNVAPENAKFSEIFPSAKPVVFNFWAGQCPPCRAEMPGFQRVYDDFKDEIILFGLDIGPFMGLGSNRDAENLLRELNIRYPTGYAHNRDPVVQNNITAMPTTLFITPDGKTFRKKVGLLRESEMREIVQDLIDAST